MSDARTEADLMRLAERRAVARLGFRNHAVIYVIVNAGLAALNLITSPGYPWFVFPLLGWGIGLAAHGLALHGVLTGDRDRAVAAELEKLRRGRV